MLCLQGRPSLPIHVSICPKVTCWCGGHLCHDRSRPEWNPCELPFDGDINFDGYRRLYGPKGIVEFDPKFYERKDVKSWKHRRDSVYGNILDEKLDFIGKYETLEADVAYLRERLRIQDKPFAHLESNGDQGRILTDQTVAEIRSLYKRDFKRFGYE